MKREKLPRGIRRRKDSPDSLVLSFALRDTRCANGQHIPDCDCGKIERRSIGECSLAYAIQQLNIYKRQVAEGSYEKRQPKPEKVRPVLVSDLLEPYLRNYRNRGKRAEWRQRMAWEHLKRTFGDVPAEELTTDLIEKYIESRRAGITDEKALLRRNGTTNRELALLRAMLTRGTKVTPRKVHQMPAFPDKLQESKARQGFIEHEQYVALTANCKPLWLRALIALAYSFGFRKGELLNLKVRQVDFLSRWLELEEGTTKNGEARKVRMTGEVFELLRACAIGKNPEDHIFTREDGEPVRDPRVEWYALCVAAGLGQWIPAKRKNGKDFLAYRGLNLHDFRRSAVRNLVRAGISEKVCMEISGHKTRAIFDKYNLSNERDLADATRKLESARQAQSQTDTKSDTPTPQPSSQSSQLPRM